MIKRLTIIASLATGILLFFVKTSNAQIDSIHCGSYNPQKKEANLPYYNDTVNVYFLYDKKGKFTYTDQDYRNDKYVTYQRIANKNFNKLESHADIVIPVSFENAELFKDVLKKYKKEDLQIKDVRFNCDMVLGSPGKWATEVCVYLEMKK